MPPQYGNPELVLNIACQGQSPCLAATPPTIRVDGRIPQEPSTCQKEGKHRVLGGDERRNGTQNWGSSHSTPIALITEQEWGR